MAITLTAMDRCDSCQAQAYVEVTFLNEMNTLLFCAHHARKCLPIIEFRYPGQFEVYDEMYRLEEVANLDVSA